MSNSQLLKENMCEMHEKIKLNENLTGSHKQEHSAKFARVSRFYSRDALQQFADQLGIRPNRKRRGSKLTGQSAVAVATSTTATCALPPRVLDTARPDVTLHLFPL